MQFRFVVALTVILATVAADGVALGMMGNCAMGQNGVATLVSACCCGPESCTQDQAQETEISEQCCSLRTPTREAETVPPPNRLVQVTTVLAADLSPQDVGPTPTAGTTMMAEIPEPTGSPPLFQLFCTYLI